MATGGIIDGNTYKTLDTIVQIDVNISTSSFSRGRYDVGLILTPSETATNLEFVSYNSASAAISGLTTMGYTAADDVYRYAVAYFGANPSPKRLVVCIFPSGTYTPATAMTAMLNGADADYYGVCLAGSTGDAQILELEQVIRSSGKPLMLFVPIIATASDAVVDGGLLAQLFALNTRRAMPILCQNRYNAAEVMGMAMGLEHENPNGSFALCYQRTVNAYPVEITDAEYDALMALNCNTFLTRLPGVVTFERGTTSSGMRYDDVMYIDQMVDALRAGLLEMIVNSDVKLPQTDSTTSLFISECNRILEQYYEREILATRTWNKAGIGNVARGDLIEHGYVCMADSFDTQSDEDRAARKAMPITILLCLSGSVESIQITLNVQQ